MKENLKEKKVSAKMKMSEGNERKKQLKTIKGET
jgi:hypothetical protein